MTRSPGNSLTQRLIALIKEFMQFGMVGAAAYVIDVSLFNLVQHGPTGFLSGHPNSAQLLASAIATVFSWLANRYWTYRGRTQKNVAREASLFITANLGGIAITQFCLLFTHHVLGLTSPLADNIAAYNSGQAIPHIINLSQVQSFALMGGSGSTLCLLIATFLVSKSAVSKNVAKLALGPGIFNINEPVLFGYPIVYNISLAIPFIGVPALGILISYLATSLGLMGPCVIQVPWTTPVFFNAFLATGGDWRAVVVQAVILAIGVLCYIPFIKVNDRVSLEA